ncbi:MAG: glycosyltransferase family 39 protein [Gemmatimonadaceae bacterium]
MKPWQADDRRMQASFAVVAAVAGVWWIAYQLAQPLGDDQGIFVWAGDVIRHGGVMYRDAWDVKGPLVYYLAAGAEYVLGHHVWAFRALDVLWQLAAAPLLFATARRLGAGTVGAVAAVALYFIWFTALESGNGAQPDAWAGILLCLVALLLLRRPRSGNTLLACGALVGTCCLIKPTYGTFLLMPAVYFIAAPTWNGRLRGLALTVVGFILPLLLSVAFFAAHGALRDYYDTYIGFTLSVYVVKDAVSWTRRMWIAFRILVLSFRFFVPALLAAVGIANLARRLPRDATMLAVWLFLTVLNVLIQGKMIWLYQYLPVYLPLAVAAGIGLSVTLTSSRKLVVRSPKPRRMSLLLAAACVIPVGMVCGGATLKLTAWTKHVLRGSPSDGFSEVEFREWGNESGTIADAAQYVERHTSPQDIVFFTDNWSGGNFLSHRDSPGRLANPRAYMDLPASRYGKAYGDEFMRTLQARPPVYVVAAASSLCSAPDFQGEYCIDRAPAAYAWLTTNYRIEKRTRWVDIWRRAN